MWTDVDSSIYRFRLVLCYEPSHLDLYYLYRYLVWFEGLRGLKTNRDLFLYWVILSE